MVASKYTDSELANLMSLPESELSPGEKRAVTRWRKRMVRENTPVVMKPVERALENGGTETSAPAAVSADGLTWYGDEWPDASVIPDRSHGAKFTVEAGALRLLPGRIARVEGHLTRAQARRVRLRIMQGRFSQFRPAGAYDARILPEDGLYSVLARYVGDAK